ncbi:MAG: hypothetical protein LUH14_11510 [Clostridiaceae bacterium]|nr:hypothetical protein [Clostridiaceae bacterium]
MTKVWLVEGFCPEDGYRCLMPVEYEPVEQDGIVEQYRKQRMACRHAKENRCARKDQCVFFEAAPERLEKNAAWYDPS